MNHERRAASGAVSERQAMRLSDLGKGKAARVRDLCAADPALEAKLREVGFAEGDDVEIVHVGPLNGRPLCVRLNRTLIALRADEAEAVAVEPLALGETTPERGAETPSEALCEVPSETSSETPPRPLSASGARAASGETS